jgi:chromosome segregation ATPase
MSESHVQTRAEAFAAAASARLTTPGEEEALIAHATANAKELEAVRGAHVASEVLESVLPISKHPKWCAFRISCPKQTVCSIVQSQLTDLRTQLEDTRTQLESTRAELSQVREQLNNSEAHRLATQEELADAQTQLADLKRDADETYVLMEASHAELVREQARANALIERCETLEAELAKVSAAAASAVALEDEGTAAAAVAGSPEATRLADTVTELEAERDRLQAGLEAATKACEELSAEHERAEAAHRQEVARLRERVADLMDALAANDGSDAGGDGPHTSTLARDLESAEIKLKGMEEAIREQQMVIMRLQSGSAMAEQALSNAEAEAGIREAELEELIAAERDAQVG